MPQSAGHPMGSQAGNMKFASGKNSWHTKQNLVLLRQNTIEQLKTKTKPKHCKEDHILI